MPALDDVTRIAATLPGSEEKGSGGGLAWFVRRNPFAWELQPWPSLDPAVRAIVAAEICLGVTLATEDDERALLQGWPHVFVPRGTTGRGIKIVIRLAAVDLDHLAELVTESWRIQAPKYLRAQLDAQPD